VSNIPDRGHLPSKALGPPIFVGGGAVQTRVKRASSAAQKRVRCLEKGRVGKEWVLSETRGLSEGWGAERSLDQGGLNCVVRLSGIPKRKRSPPIERNKPSIGEMSILGERGP